MSNKSTIVQLAPKHRVKVGNGVEIGPLVADDTGIGVQAKRKWLSKSRPGLHYIVHWSKVTGYTIGAPTPRMIGGSTINSHHTQLELRTADNVFSWELPIDRTLVTKLVGSALGGDRRRQPLTVFD